MKKLISLLICSILLFCGTVVVAYGADKNSGAGSLSEVVEQATSDNATEAEQGEPDEKTDITEKNNDFIAGLNEVSDLTNINIKESEAITKELRTIAAFIVQIISYFIIVMMSVRVMVDLLYITITPMRAILGNGYSGNSGQSQMVGMRQAVQKAYNIQFVSNAALNAVAAASIVGPNGASPNPLKLYFKDMVILMILTPVLIVLAATGVLTQIGFLVADIVVSLITKAAAAII